MTRAGQSVDSQSWLWAARAQAPIIGAGNQPCSSRGRARASRVSWRAVLAASCRRDDRPPALPLTSLHDLRRAMVAAGPGERGVDVRGVVTYSDAAAGMLYLQGATGSAAVGRWATWARRWSGGESVQLSGLLPAGAGPVARSRPRLTVHGALQPGADAGAAAPGPGRAAGARGRGGVGRGARRGALGGHRRLGAPPRAPAAGPPLPRGDPEPRPGAPRLAGGLPGPAARGQPGAAPRAASARPTCWCRTWGTCGWWRMPPPIPSRSRWRPRPACARCRRTPGPTIACVCAGACEPEVGRAGVRAGGGRAASGRSRPATRRRSPPASGSSWSPSPARATARRPSSRPASAGWRTARAPTAAPPLPPCRCSPPPTQVRRLSPAEALEGLPDPAAGGRDLQRSRHAAALRAGRAPRASTSRPGGTSTGWRPGDRVEVEGRSAPGAFAPIVDHPRVRVLGTARCPRPVPSVPRAGQRPGGQPVGGGGGRRARRHASRRRAAAHPHGGRAACASPWRCRACDGAGAGAARERARARAGGVPLAAHRRRASSPTCRCTAPARRRSSVLTPPPRRARSRCPCGPSAACCSSCPDRAGSTACACRASSPTASPASSFVRDEHRRAPRAHRRAARPRRWATRWTPSASPPPATTARVLRTRTCARSGRGAAAGPRADHRRAGHERPVRRRAGARSRRGCSTACAAATQAQLSLQAGPYLFTGHLRGAPAGRASSAPGAQLRLTGICAVNAGEQRVPQALPAPAARARRRRGPDARRPWWTPRRAAWIAGGHGRARRPGPGLGGDAAPARAPRSRSSSGTA